MVDSIFDCRLLGVLICFLNSVEDMMNISSDTVSFDLCVLAEVKDTNKEFYTTQIYSLSYTQIN